MKYQIDNMLRSDQLDRYETGCDGPVTETPLSIAITAETTDELFKRMAGSIGADEKEFLDQMEIDVCDDDGRVEFSRYETGSGDPATAIDVEKWKKGEKKLYYVTYMAWVEGVVEVSLRKETAPKPAEKFIVCFAVGPNTGQMTDRWAAYDELEDARKDYAELTSGSLVQTASVCKVLESTDYS